MNTSFFHVSAAYGGDGWQPRTCSTREEMGSVWGQFGSNSEWAPLTRVLLHRPGDELDGNDAPDAIQFVDRLDVARARAQHDAMADAYRTAGVAVHYLDLDQPAQPNQMFLADLMFMTPEGAVLARPASTVRAGEERHTARKLAELGVPIVRSISGTGTFEGADAIWIDAQTVLIGRGLRTNAVGTDQLRSVLDEMGVQTIAVDLPFGSMHLMGMLRLVDRDLATAWPTRLAVAAVEALRARDISVAFLPDPDEAHHCSAHNYVTLGPREILMAADVPNTQRFYESLGITCHTVDISELRKAAGAIGCLSGIVQRELI